MDTKKQLITLFFILLLSLFAVSFVFADSLEIFQLYSPSELNPVQDSRLNGTVVFNFTVLGPDTTPGMTANVTQVSISFTNAFDSTTTSMATSSALDANLNISKLYNLTVDTTTVADGRYNITVSLTNVTGTETTNTTVTNITIDNNAPSLSYADSTLADDNYTSYLRYILVNITIDDLTPINITFTFANSTTVNSTTYVNHFNGHYLTDRVTNRNVSYNFTVPNSMSEGTWTYNVTVIDQYLRSTTSTTRSTGVDTTNPSNVVISSSGGNEIRRTAETTMSCSATEPNPSTLVLSQGDTTVCSSSGTSCSGTYTPGTTGDKAFACNVTDLAGNTNNAGFVLEVDSSSSSSTSGGGGGSARSVTYSDISEGDTPKFKIADSVLGVDEVSFTAKDDISLAKVVVTPKNSEDFTVTPENTVYKYFDITAESVDSDDIQDSSITFTVSDAWLTQQGAKTEDVVLLRLEGDEWKAYDTTLLKVESGLHFLTATTPGLSDFAAALKTELSSTSEVKETVESPVVEEGVEEVMLPVEKEPKSKRGWLLVIAILFILVAGWVFYNAKYSKLPPHMRKRKH